ncbi:hypothetical protein L1049_006607 [Liquidambar formosana]|uniref:Uncharacterized protein n=1 Tax=Liquidambar formosana TaxID=63359 RepID=A0AAP0RHF9_LIQFO
MKWVRRWQGKKQISVIVETGLWFGLHGQITTLVAGFTVAQITRQMVLVGTSSGLIHQSAYEQGELSPDCLKRLKDIVQGKGFIG